MNLVIISGQEAAGKTAIGIKVSELLDYRFLGKDTIKEVLFDAKPRNTWHFRWYDEQAKTALFSELQRFIARNESVVVESNFLAEDTERLQKLLTKEVAVTEIFCTTKGLTSFRRFVARNESGERHKGHHDRRCYPLVFIEGVLKLSGIQWPYKPIGLSKELLSIDTTDFWLVDYDEIANFVRSNSK